MYDFHIAIHLQVEFNQATRKKEGLFNPPFILLCLSMYVCMYMYMNNNWLKKCAYVYVCIFICVCMYVWDNKNTCDRATIFYFSSMAACCYWQGHFHRSEYYYHHYHHYYHWATKNPLRLWEISHLHPFCFLCFNLLTRNSNNKYLYTVKLTTYYIRCIGGPKEYIHT